MEIETSNLFDNRNFHKADTRWELFGCQNFDSYLDKFLIRGLFHSKVPDMIVESYITVEYMIAHAYYFYPMYDEALAKLLRIMEMAVKIRCKEIGIDIIDDNKINKRTYNFNTLIEKLSFEEPHKNLKNALHAIRNLRNYKMHLDKNSYSGGMSASSIILCVNSLNILFAPNSFFLHYKSKMESYIDKIKLFYENPSIFESSSRNFLCYKIQPVDLILYEKKEILCIHVELILNKIEVIDENTFPFSQSFILYISDFLLENNCITGFDMLTGEYFNIQTTDNPSTVTQFNSYRKHLNDVIKTGNNSICAFRKMEINKAIAEFKYCFYQHLVSED